MDREDFRTIDFEAELQKGHTSYDREVGQWWRQQANDGSHQAAYRKVADYCRKLFSDSEPGIVIDYACGPGLLLTRLCRGSRNHWWLALMAPMCNWKMPMSACGESARILSSG